LPAPHTRYIVAMPEAKRRPRRGQNPFGIVPVLILLVLIGGGLFVIFQMRDMASIQDCVASGRRNCAPVGVGR
jgi:hypothetical protein